MEGKRQDIKKGYTEMHPGHIYKYTGKEVETFPRLTLRTGQ